MHSSFILVKKKQQKDVRPLKGMKQFLMLTENEHVPASDVDDNRRVLRWLTDVANGDALFHTSRTTQLSNTL